MGWGGDGRFRRSGLGDLAKGGRQARQGVGNTKQGVGRHGTGHAGRGGRDDLGGDAGSTVGSVGSEAGVGVGEVVEKLVDVVQAGSAGGQSAGNAQGRGQDGNRRHLGGDVLGQDGGVHLPRGIVDHDDGTGKVLVRGGVGHADPVLGTGVEPVAQRLSDGADGGQPGVANVGRGREPRQLGTGGRGCQSQTIVHDAAFRVGEGMVGSPGTDTELLHVGIVRLEGGLAGRPQIVDAVGDCGVTRDCEISYMHW